MKKTFFTILFFALSFTLSFGQSGGTGTSGDPYQISTYADLVWLQGASTEWGKYFLQTANIDAAATSGDGWNPLGNDTFDGTYDGGGFAIDNLTIDGAGSLGFIQKTSSTTTIKNLGLTNVNITITGGNDGYTGALVSHMDGGTVENCYSTGNIISNLTREYYNYGGLIARINAGSDVRDSYSEVNISNADSSVNVGGFVGYNNGGSITKCYATGTIQGGSAVGGFVGENNTGSDITKSYSTGNVTASSSSSGGFVGYNYKGTVSECYSRGDVSGTARVGGFIGFNRRAGAVVSNCYSFGEVTGNVGGHVGGFCGRNYQTGATIEYCYSTGVCNDKGFMGASYNGTPVVTDCFFDATTSGGTDSYATGETTTNMKIQATFTNWNFGTVWEMVGANYPRLKNQQDSALPVELTSFTASTSSATGSVVLNWETATEVNNYGFDVESSNDNVTFSKVGFVSGHGNSNTPQSYSFTSTDGAKYYRLKQVDMDGSFKYSEVVEVEGNLTYKLSQNYPNPFNPTTVISFSIPEVSKVSITVFNALGQEVAELANREFSVGNHSVNFNASNLTSGIYFYRLNSANFSKTMKMLLIK